MDKKSEQAIILGILHHLNLNRDMYFYASIFLIFFILDILHLVYRASNVKPKANVTEMVIHCFHLTFSSVSVITHVFNSILDNNEWLSYVYGSILFLYSIFILILISYTCCYNKPDKKIAKISSVTFSLIYISISMAYAGIWYNYNDTENYFKFFSKINYLAISIFSHAWGSISNWIFHSDDDIDRLDGNPVEMQGLKRNNGINF